MGKYLDDRVNGVLFQKPDHLRGNINTIGDDKNLVEIFANDRQGIAVEHEHIRENPNISIFTGDKDLQVPKLKAWKMKSIYR